MGSPSTRDTKILALNSTRSSHQSLVPSNLLMKHNFLPALVYIDDRIAPTDIRIYVP
jgi:hypothetical protein